VISTEVLSVRSGLSSTLLAVSRAVEFAEVRRHVDEFGRRATIVTVTATATPHVVSAMVDMAGDRLRADVGPTTRANLLANAGLTLTWLPAGSGDYMLILDGVADHIGDPDDGGVSSVSIAVTRGILHRLAGVPDDLPSCVTLGQT
jgi:hypothetical protein